MNATIETNKEIVSRIYAEMWNRHDPSAADRLFAGAQGVRKFLEEFLRAFPDLEHTVEELLAEDERVAARFTARGTHLGTWKGLEATGKRVTYSGLTLARIEAGRITWHHTWWNELGLLEQIKAG